LGGGGRGQKENSKRAPKGKREEKGREGRRLKGREGGREGGRRGGREERPDLLHVQVHQILTFLEETAAEAQEAVHTSIQGGA
jgi:hypothetical protein